MPKKLTAHTGMDAMTHAIEAYVSTLNSPFTDPLAIKAIEMVLDYLPQSYKCDMNAREQMHYAQCLAGQAFSNALLGIVHSMAHKTGAAFSTGHIPHGCANAIYLPYVIKYNAHEPEAMHRYADIARRVGLGGTSEKAQVNALIAKIEEFNRAMNIPKTLQEFGVKEDEFKEKLKAGLNPKTSLAGMTRHYEKGDRSFKFLAAYAGTLKTADENEKFQEVADYYLEHIDSAGLYLPQSWEILWNKGKRYDSEWFRFIYDHRNELVEKNGEKVLNFIVQVLFSSSLSLHDV